MSIANNQPVTWQDYANLWANDPAFKEQYKVIKPTLDAMGITPQDIQDTDTITIELNIRPVEKKGAVSPYDPGYIGDDDDTPVTPGNNNYPSADSTLGPGLPPQAEPYRDAIESASRITGVPASLLAGLIHDESRWNPHAGTTNGGNGMGDTGLVQMNDATFAELQAKHPELQGRDKNDPETNILAGAFYLADMREAMKEKYGRDDWEIALRAYNSGPNGVDPSNLSNLPAGTGTSNYVDKVMNYWNIIENGGTLPA